MVSKNSAFTLAGQDTASLAGKDFTARLLPVIVPQLPVCGFLRGLNHILRELRQDFGKASNRISLGVAIWG